MLIMENVQIFAEAIINNPIQSQHYTFAASPKVLWISSEVLTLILSKYVIKILIA